MKLFFSVQLGHLKLSGYGLLSTQGVQNRSQNCWVVSQSYVMPISLPGGGAKKVGGPGGLRGIVNYVACTSNFFLKICVCVQLSVADLFPVPFGEQRGSHCARATRLIFPALDHTRQSDLTRIEI